jgi:hypothetical protein
LLATADLPLPYDLNTIDGRREMGFSDDDNRRLRGTQVVGFRVRNGEDASCLNLYQTSQPRVLGAPPRLAKQSRFQWAAVDAGVHPPTEPSPAQSDDRENDAWKWQSLDISLAAAAADQAVVPMVLDRNTAMYSLKLFAVGDRLNIRDAADRPVALQVVGLLANSVLQGAVIISEPNFLKLFPEVAGQQFFLIRRGADAPPVDELASLLETRLEDFGFDAVATRARLAELMAVQNTYLSTFQTLGALGLLLGSVGLAVAQARSILERRGELALMQSAGFRRRRLVRMVLLENLSLLLGGLAIGCLAALTAVLPHAVVEQAGVPWKTLAALLAIVAAVGVLATWLAARGALRAPLLPALRGD